MTLRPLLFLRMKHLIIFAPSQIQKVLPSYFAHIQELICVVIVKTEFSVMKYLHETHA